MCEPVSTGAVLLGGLSAGSSALGAIGRNQSAQAQAAAQAETAERTAMAEVQKQQALAQTT